MIPATKNCVGIAQLLIKSGANMHQQNKEGNTSLMLTSINNSKEVGELLIKSRAKC